MFENVLHGVEVLVLKLAILSFPIFSSFFSFNLAWTKPWSFLNIRFSVIQVVILNPFKNIFCKFLFHLFNAIKLLFLLLFQKIILISKISDNLFYFFFNFRLLTNYRDTIFNFRWFHILCFKLLKN